MAPKRPPPKPRPSDDDWKITDEWGLYDPAKAGMQALFARLGRPVLSAAKTTARTERRRAQRPERSSEGVGLAIAEARRRAELHHEAAIGTIPQSAARAMRMALQTQGASVEHPVPTVVPVEHEQSAPPPPEHPPARRRRARTAPAATKAVKAAIEPLVPATAPAAAGKQRRASAGTAKSRARASAAPRHAAEAPAPDPATPVASPPPAPTRPPAPSPRRPRGPVPLAAWARSVADSVPEPVRPADKRGFWRGVFMIPAEVALVEYAHGCRIQRLLIEAAAEPSPDFI